MYEKVNPKHPDKVADRIAGALVDLAYNKTEAPKVAVEVLIGHGYCHIINETDTPLDELKVWEAVKRITEDDTLTIDYVEKAQDTHLADNQRDRVRCGDNGIFKGMPVTYEQEMLTDIARWRFYNEYESDGKYLIADKRVTICQSNMPKDDEEKQKALMTDYDLKEIIINPLGEWTGGTDVDCGATNRKLGSDMGDAVTGGGLHGKDCSKGDVSINVMCHILANEYGSEVTAATSIGDEYVTFRNAYNGDTEMEFSHVVSRALKYIARLGGFERLAEWGLIR